MDPAVLTDLNKIISIYTCTTSRYVYASEMRGHTVFDSLVNIPAQKMQEISTGTVRPQLFKCSRRYSLCDERTQPRGSVVFPNPDVRSPGTNVPINASHNNGIPHVPTRRVTVFRTTATPCFTKKRSIGAGPSTTPLHTVNADKSNDISLRAQLYSASNRIERCSTVA